MNNITVIGAGASGLSFIKRMREAGNKDKITLIDRLGFLFDNRDFISLNLRKRADYIEWCKKHEVEFINAEVERLNLQRKKIYFKEADPRDFETLVVADGLKPQKLGIKGEQKEGVFYFTGVDPVKLRDMLRISTEALVYATSFLGIRLAVGLRVLKKEVRVIAPNWEFLGPQQAELLSFFSGLGITVNLNCWPLEAIGEGALKAVKVEPLKVYSADLLFIDNGFLPNRDIFEEPLQLKGEIFSGYSDIYLTGACLQDNVEKERFFPYNYQFNQKQGEALADHLLGGPVPVSFWEITDQEAGAKLVNELIGSAPIAGG